jgi:hypothetical protein
MIGMGTPRSQSRIPREKFIAILLVSEDAVFVSWDAEQQGFLVSET